MTIPSRQVLRAAARKNDYWAPDKWGHIVAPTKPRKCRRENAAGRERTSCNIIRAKTARKRLSPRPEPRHPKGMRHAWQRKAAFWAAVKKAKGQ